MRQETTGNEWESKQFFKKNFSEFDFIGEDGRDQWEAADQSQLQVRLLTLCIVLLVWPLGKDSKKVCNFPHWPGEGGELVKTGHILTLFCFVLQFVPLFTRVYFVPYELVLSISISVKEEDKLGTPHWRHIQLTEENILCRDWEEIQLIILQLENISETFLLSNVSMK